MAVSPSYSSCSGNDPVMGDIAVNFDDLLDTELFGEVVFVKNEPEINVCDVGSPTQQISVLDDADWLSDSSLPGHDSSDVQQVEDRKPTKIVTVASDVGQYALRPRHVQVLSNNTNTKKQELSKSSKFASKKRSYSEIEEFDCEDDKNSKAAVQARLNRQKKKAYIQGLESQVAELSKENSVLKCDNNKLNKEKNLFCEEITYLRGVLKNDSMLSDLLSNMASVTNVRLTSSFTNANASHEVDHDYGKPNKVGTRPTKKQAVAMSSGVCLHVESGNVSLEFCSKCALMAKGADRSVLQS